jgi:hypothetical protein
VVLTLGICSIAEGATFVARDSAPELAEVIARDPDSVTSASFLSVPTSGEPNAVANGYGPNVTPLHGLELGVLSNGDARVPADPGYPGRDGVNKGTDVTGGDVRGGNDVTILRLELDVPATTNCLTVSFDFFTMDFSYTGPNPETVTDGFLAELDPAEPWSISGAATTHPANFAVSDVFGGVPVSKDWTFAGSSQYLAPNGQNVAANAVGTGYEMEQGASTPESGALGWITAMTPVSPGAHTLDLSIFDRQDGVYDSAVLLDDLRFIRRRDGACPRGASFDTDFDAPPVTLESPTNGSSTTNTAPAIRGSRGTGDGDSDAVSVKLYSGDAASGTPVETLAATVAGSNWQAAPSPLRPGVYTVQAEQEDAAGNAGLSAAHTFTVTATPDVPGGATPDAAAPEGRVTAARRQSLRRQKGALIATAGPFDEAAAVTASASLNVPKVSRIFRLRRVSRELVAGTRSSLRVRLSRGALKAARRALARRRRVRATITLRVSDAAGNARNISRAIRVVR